MIYPQFNVPRNINQRRCVAVTVEQHYLSDIVHYVGTITHPLIREVLRRFIAPPALRRSQPFPLIHP